MLKLIIYLLLVVTVMGEELKINYESLFLKDELPRAFIDIESGKILKTNMGAEKLYGYKIKELEDMTVFDLNQSAKEVTQRYLKLAQDRTPGFMRFEHKNKMGKKLHLDVYLYPFIQNEKDILYSIVIDRTNEVISQEKLQNNHNKIVGLTLTIISLLFIILYFVFLYMKKYKNIAYIDHLTGVYTRRLLHCNSFSKLISEKNLAVVMIDINDFKEINDCYGHIIGDEVLTSICEIIQKDLRKEDIVIRYGGDEFLLILKDSNIEKSKFILNRITQNLKKLNKFPFEISLSFGIDLLSDDGSLFDSIKIADDSMYNMKKFSKTYN